MQRRAITSSATAEARQEAEDVGHVLFDSLRLSQLQRENKRLYRAYLLKDALGSQRPGDPTARRPRFGQLDPGVESHKA